MAFGFGFGMPRSFAVPPFSPASLFAGGIPGVWYDPSDYGATGTLFQDSAGTTPVTAVEQPVGLMLDKSQGLVLGPEKSVNGDFSNGTTGWATASGATLTLDSTVIAGGAKITSAGVGSSAYLVVSGLVVGKIYAASIRLYLPSSNTVNSCATFSLLGLHDSGRKNIPEDSIQTVPYYFTAISTSAQLAVTMVNPGVAWSASGDVVYIDDLSVKELPGNHAFQSTSASRPVLSARYNLLTKTEQFDDDAVWAKVNGTTVSSNATAAPDGTLTADKLVSAASTNNFFIATVGAVGGAGTYAFSIYAKVAEWGFIGLTVNGGGFTDRQYSIELATGTATSITGLGGAITFNSQAVGNGWVRVSFAVSLTGVATFRFGPRQNSSGVNQVGDGTSGVFFWGAQLESAT